MHIYWLQTTDRNFQQAVLTCARHDEHGDYIKVIDLSKIGMPSGIVSTVKPLIPIYRRECFEGEPQRCNPFQQIRSNRGLTHSVRLARTDAMSEVQKDLRSRLN